MFAELRGNVDTRLQKAEQHDAIVVAAAALDRLGRGDRAAERLDVELMLPMVAQGALAVECRADDAADSRTAAAIDDDTAHTAVRAERAFLAELGGGCSLPCRRATRTVRGDRIAIDGLLASLDGRVVVRRSLRGLRSRRSSADAVAREVLEHGGRGPGGMTVYLVGAGPGDPGLVTVAARGLLARADVVVYDRLASPALLELAPADAELISAGKAPGHVETHPGRDQRAARGARQSRA